MSDPAAGLVRDTYLSIDLDYWNKAPFEPALLDAVFASGLPVVVTLDHHDILPHVNAQRGLRRVFNIDYHSDFFSTPEPLHCGNWVNFVAWRDHARYTWALPRLNDYHLRWGYCHVGPNPFLDPVRLAGWALADKQEGYDLVELMPTVAAVGICISPTFLDDGSDAHAAFLNLHRHLRRAGIAVHLGAIEKNQVRYRERLAAIADALAG